MKLHPKMLAGLLGLMATVAYGAEYYVVVPMPGKTNAAETPSAPTITLTLNGYPLPAAMVGRAYAGFNFNTVLQVAGDAAFDAQAVSWDVVSGALPAGLMLGADGQLSGTPTAAGVSSFQVKASYKTAAGTQAFEILTGEVVVTLHSATLPAALVGRAYAGFDFNTVLQVSGAESFDGQAVTWELVGGALPAGLTLGADGVLSGTPSVAGTSVFQVKASYQTASGVQAFELLAGEMSVGLAAATLPAAVQGAAYSFDFKPQLAVSGDPAFTPGQVLWVLEGTLPQGLTFNTDGTITGVPTAAGNYPFTVRAQYLNKEGVQSYQVMVGEIVVSLAAVTAPSGVIGQAYAGVDLKPLVSVTGDAAYANTGLSWRVATGALPAGLTLADGAISGTPSAKAAGAATVEVSYKGKTAQQPVTITVSDSIKQFSGYRAWSDGSLAASCLEYKQGKTGYVYAGAVGDGVYRIQPGGAALTVFCDMTTDGGGWTLVMTNNLPNFTNASATGTSAVCTTLSGCNTGGTSNFYLNTPVEGKITEMLFAATSTGNPMENQWRLTNPAPFIRDNTPAPGVSLFRLMTDNALGWVPASEIGVPNGGDRNQVERMFTGTYGTWSDGNWWGVAGRQGLQVHGTVSWGHHHYNGYTFDGTNYTLGAWTYYPYSGGAETKVISKHAAEQLYRWSVFVR